MGRIRTSLNSCGRIRLDVSHCLPLLGRFASRQDSLLCAKHLFVGATIGCAARFGRRVPDRRGLGRRDSDCLMRFWAACGLALGPGLRESAARAPRPNKKPPRQGQHGSSRDEGIEHRVGRRIVARRLPPRKLNKAVPMPPIRLSDSELDAVMAAARPLPVARRDAFLQAVAAELQGRQIGPDLVHRICAEVQREYFDPPDLAMGTHGRASKYR